MGTAPRPQEIIMHITRTLPAFLIAPVIALGFATVSVSALAQTANTPGGQAATGSALDQTTTTPQRNVPKTTATSPDQTNPSGAVTKTRTHKTKTNPTEPGDAPTYPAPAPDGTPTK